MGAGVDELAGRITERNVSSQSESSDGANILETKYYYAGHRNGREEGMLMLHQKIIEDCGLCSPVQWVFLGRF